MRFYSLTMASASSTILFIGILTASSVTVLAHPVTLQNIPEQVPPDMPQLTEYLFMPAENSEIIGQMDTVTKISPVVFYLTPSLEMIPDIASSTTGDLSYLDLTAAVNPLTPIVTGTIEALLYTFQYSSDTTPSPIPTTTASISEDTSVTPRLGPGPVIHPTASSLTKSLNSVTSEIPYVPSNTMVSDPFIVHDPGAAAPETSHRATVIVGGVLSGLFAFSMITCVLLHMRRLRCMLFARGVHRNLDPLVIKDSEKPSALMPEANPEGHTYVDSAQPVSPVFPSWMKLPSQISPFQSHRDSLLSYFRLTRYSTYAQPSKLHPQKPQKTRILDIVPDFPRSRFSVTSSDYSHSINSIEPHPRLEHAIVSSRKSVPLLTPEEFFSLPSSTTIISRHSRAGSAPVFGRHRKDARLDSMLSMAKFSDKGEKPDTRSSTRSRAMSVAVVQSQNLQRRRTRSIAVVENGVWS
ncbi:hypothetical protein J3R30DRAFT_3419398 [Lentinula aciculospora]|uniref:Uncharacterized protein n=1 Tax=Lentinula aciculospora TaxID=153920 RepID=A0A9W9ATF4_9AGAR|nr:hypothetical protein J3R30DRAFT_3419398 [Lentinula aciculospora]